MGAAIKKKTKVKLGAVGEWRGAIVEGELRKGRGERKRF